MRTKNVSRIVFGITIACVQVSCIQPLDDEEQAVRATSSPVDQELSSVTAGSLEPTWPPWPPTYLCRYLCPEIPRIFNGTSNYPAQACQKAESACLASCLSCEFYEIIERP